MSEYWMYMRVGEGDGQILPKQTKRTETGFGEAEELIVAV